MKEESRCIHYRAQMRGIRWKRKKMYILLLQGRSASRFLISTNSRKLISVWRLVKSVYSSMYTAWAFKWLKICECKMWPAKVLTASDCVDVWDAIQSIKVFKQRLHCFDQRAHICCATLARLHQHFAALCRQRKVGTVSSRYFRCTGAARWARTWIFWLHVLHRCFDCHGESHVSVECMALQKSAHVSIHWTVYRGSTARGKCGF